MTLGIPKRLAHIWIGPKRPPLDWMQTWRDHHPDWEYVLYDNAFLTSRRWRCQKQINTYFAAERYEGVGDLMRYEILHEVGGFIAEADMTCLRACDDLFTSPTLYTVYENEIRKPGLVQPFLAAAPGHGFLNTILDDLSARDPGALRMPWKETGNRYLRRAIASHSPEITVFPSHYFLPNHKSGERYTGADPAYAEHHWGTTRNTYESLNPAASNALRASVLAQLEAVPSGNT